LFLKTNNLKRELNLKGVIPPVVTPLIDGKRLDYHGLENLVEHLLNGGVHGLILLGTTGEGPSLSLNLRREFLKKATELVDGRVPVLVGIADNVVSDAIEMAAFAGSIGVEAALVAPPSYFPIDESEAIAYFAHLTEFLPLPFLLYNIPSHTKINLSLAVVKRAQELGAIGIKDSSGNLDSYYEMLNTFKDTPDFSVLMGTELFLPETIQYGGQGVVAGGANMFPELFVALYHACLNQDVERISILHAKVIRIHHTIYKVGKGVSRFIKGTKCTLDAMGICNDSMAYPHQRFSKSDREKIGLHVGELLEMSS
jgi:4-hydroxy-tetrahydrodipicolinate synthase